MENERAIETKDLTVSYGKHRGITDVDLAVESGEVYGFLGPNGAGKTTTMRTLLDLIRPVSGTATIFGLDCQRQGAHAREYVGYMPGDLNMYSQLSGKDYLSMITYLRGNHIDKRYTEMLCQRLDLNVNRRIGEYSTGNRRKLGLVAAFMPQPQLLMLDEPTSGLDPLVQETVLDMVREAVDGGSTVFFSTHVLSEAETICDRVALIREGRVITVESVKSLTAKRLTTLSLELAHAVSAEAIERKGVEVLSIEGNLIRVQITSGLPEFMRQMSLLGIESITTEPVTLESVFLSYYRGEEAPRV